VVSTPPHLSKGEGYVLAPGDWIAVKTPGGGGYGPAAERDPAMVERDIARGYYTDVEAVRLFTRTHAAAAE
jgi:N-methylhydantoinase B